MGHCYVHFAVGVVFTFSLSQEVPRSLDLKLSYDYQLSCRLMSYVDLSLSDQSHVMS